MSKLEELIKQLCPNGVEYKTLGELGKFYGGITGKSKEDFKDGNAKFITYKNVYENISLKLDVEDKVKISEKENQRTLEYGDIIFTGSSETPDECGISSVITKKVEEKLYLNSFCFFFRMNNKEILNPDFAKHLFRSSNLRYQIGKTASGVTRFNVSKKAMEKICIPVPPLEVQCEIVHILDDFTLLSAKLSAELKARQKQYEYYSEKLLNENCEENYVKLGDITKTITKGTTPKRFADKGINFIKTEAFDGMNINKNKLSFVDKETHNGFLKRSILEENDILFTIAGATIGKMAIVKKELLPANTNQALAIIRLKDDINVHYIKFILKSSFMKKYIKKCIKGSAQPNLNLQQLNDFLVPFPNDEKQKEIMNILERFDKLCNDISEGLPAEIEARQKQYEYYRDKLLTFKELKVNE